MSQPNFKDPIVSGSITRTGTGNGAVSVDKLTHFTIAQTYTLTCISKTPDTVFSVSGSLDGPVGIATVGSQFFDEDLKVFLTITQGSTAFEVGDQFTFLVINGTDLNQDNIDDYDESIQKNFGAGIKGTLSGDHSLRLSLDAVPAHLFIESLKFTSVVSGDLANDVAVEYAAPIPGTSAAGSLEGLNFTTVVEDAAANGVTVEFLQNIAPVKAEVTVQNVNYQAITTGVGGNAITVAYTTGATAGSEAVSVVGNAISVQIASGVSTPAQIVSKVNAHMAASALVFAKVTPVSNTTPQTGPVSATNLVGGINSSGSAGSEVVQVTGQAITVRCENLVSTQAQVKAALDAYPAAAALITTTVTSGSTAVGSPSGPVVFTGGADGIGYSGFERASLFGSVVTVNIEPGVSTYQAIKDAVDDEPTTAAVITVELIGDPTDSQSVLWAQENLSGGENKFFAFNQEEITNSSDFEEGNASLRVDELKVADRLTVERETQLKSQLALNAPGSGPEIGNTQRKINDIQNELEAHEAADTDVHGIGADNQVVGTGTGQVLTNKDIDGGVASDESRITLPKENTAALAALTRKEGTMVYDTVIKKVFYDDGTSLLPIGSGSGGVPVRVHGYDLVTTTLPATTAYLIDGQTVVTDMLVLFDALTSDPHRVYKATVVGINITWVAQSVFTDGLDPDVGESIRVIDGINFELALGTFDGTTFKFGNFTRYYNGNDYFEQSAIISVSIAASTTAPLFTVGYLGSENIVVEFSIIRGSSKETGVLYVTTDGATAQVSQGGAAIALSGISFSAIISGSDVILRYTSDAGTTGLIKFITKRWSDGAGGPAGVPTYGVVTAPTAAAAGTAGQVQYNDAGNLGADAGMTYDATEKSLGLSGLEVVGLRSFSLADAQGSPQDIFQYDSSDYPFVILEFSIIRDGNQRMGRVMLNNNTSTVSQTDDNNDNGTVGVTLSAVIVGSNVVVRYTSTSTGFSGTLKYSMRRWS